MSVLSTEAATCTTLQLSLCQENTVYIHMQLQDALISDGCNQNPVYNNIIDVEHVMQINKTELVYDPGDLTGELYRMNLSCLGAESGCMHSCIKETTGCMWSRDNQCKERLIRTFLFITYRAT